MRIWGGLRERITYANVVATMALFLAICGGAVAASQLAKNSVGPKQLKKNSVTSVKIKKDAVNGAKVKDGSLSGADLKDGTITGPKIADGAITPAKLSVAPVPAPAAPTPSVTAVSLTEDCTSATGPLPAGVSASEITFGCKVDFGRNVYNCAATATAFLRTAALVLLSEDTAEISMTPAQPNVMFVHTYVEGSPNDWPFDLVVIC
jgi:hypothetical protein